MRLTKFFAAALIMGLVLVTTVAVAQKNYTAEADLAFEMQKYYDAVDLYKKAYSKVRNKPEKRRILFQIAECYRKSNDLNKAEGAYKRAIRAGFPQPIVYFRYAEILKTRGKYDLAKEQYALYIEEVPNDKRGRMGHDYCDSAMMWLENPTRWEIEPMKRMNSRENDFSPMYADRKNYNVLVFTSSREESTGKHYDQWTGAEFTDLFYITKDRKEQWSRAQLFDDDEIINTAANEGGTSFNKKANVIYFSRCTMEKKKRLGCDIYFAKKRGKKWGAPEALQIVADSVKAVQPSISLDEKMIYFVSDMPGGYGGADIWVARRTRKTKPFDKPENLGPVINTSGNEMFPYLRQDGVLYFASDGHPGMGGLDIFKSTMEKGKWTTPVNMKAPINSEADDFGIVLEGEEKRFGEEENGFMTSNRVIKGSRGGDDIYKIHLPAILFTLAGTIRDDQTLQLMPGVKVKLSGSDKSTLETVTDGRGKYRFNKEQILPKVTYTLQVAKNGYFSQEGKESTVGLMVSTDLIHNFNLVPIPPDPIPLPEIRYKLADHKLQEQYQDSLADLVNRMKLHPTIVVELISHTDFRGQLDYNDSLSFRRSRSCVEYVISQGIEPARISPVGKGEREPRTIKEDITLNGETFVAGTVLTEEYINKQRTTRRKEAAHQLNRRTEFRIIRSDYVPQAANTKIDSVDVGDIVITLNPEDNVIPFHTDENDAIKSQCIVNGLTVEFTYMDGQEDVSMSLEQAQAMLKATRIVKGDFLEKDSAIDENGQIKDGMVLIIKTLNFGSMELTDVRVVVVHDQSEAFSLGEATLSKLGTFTVNRDKMQFIFEEN